MSVETLIKDVDKIFKEREALEVLEAMPEPEFQSFFNSLPERVRILCRANFTDWRDVLPAWYVNLNAPSV